MFCDLWSVSQPFPSPRIRTRAVRPGTKLCGAWRGLLRPQHDRDIETSRHRDIETSRHRVRRDPEHIKNQFGGVTFILERSHPTVFAMLTDAQPELLALPALPGPHWLQIWSTKLLSVSPPSNDTSLSMPCGDLRFLAPGFALLSGFTEKGLARHGVTIPPLTFNVSPTTKLDSADARKT